MANYNPNSKYQWNKEDVFELSGEEFGILLNGFRAALNTPEAARILLIAEANKIMENIMAKAVEKDIVKEMIEENKLNVN